MPAETTPRRKGYNKYTIVFVPNDQTKRSRSFSVNIIGLIGVILGMIGLLVGAVILLVTYTPIGKYLPISSPHIEQLYGKKVTEIELQLTSLVKEVTQLQSYNQRLRQALGENPSADSTGAPGANVNLASKGTKRKRDEQKNAAPQGQQQMQEPVQGQQTMGSVQQGEMPAGGKEIRGTQFFPLTMPVLGYESKNYNNEQNHLGIDIVAKEGSPIVAAGNGSVIYSDWTLDDGYMMIIEHSDGFTTVYKHAKALLKNRGAMVRRGETIALLGNTGRTSSGPHLHFEVWNNGVALNPMNYVISLE